MRAPHEPSTACGIVHFNPCSPRVKRASEHLLGCPARLLTPSVPRPSLLTAACAFAAPDAPFRTVLATGLSPARKLWLYHHLHVHALVLMCGDWQVVDSTRRTSDRCAGSTSSSWSAAAHAGGQNRLLAAKAAARRLQLRPPHAIRRCGVQAPLFEPIGRRVGSILAGLRSSRPWRCQPCNHPSRWLHGLFASSNSCLGLV